MNVQSIPDVPRLSARDACWRVLYAMGLTWSLLYLLLSAPNYTFINESPRYSGSCPGIVSQKREWRHRGETKGQDIIEMFQGAMRVEDDPNSHSIDCNLLISDDQNEIDYASRYNFCRDTRSVDNVYSIMGQEGCERFLDIFGYKNLNVTEEEKSFPLAFSILTYEDLHQTERLLHAIYKPQNIYCIHVDAKADSAFYTAIQYISTCLPNVIVPTNNINVHWAEYSVLEAELICMKALLDHSTMWKYFINLTGREFPLKTNLELVQILKAYNGANDIDGSMYNRNTDWMNYVWKAENWRTNSRKSRVPAGFNIHKGSAHIVATRAFVNYAVYDERARELADWMRDTRLPDEHFFNTLNHNPHLGVPGAFTGDPALKPFYGRLKLWWENEDSTCSGQWARYICNLGVRELPNVVTSRHLFVNKIRRDVSPLAYECLLQWHENRTRQAIPLKEIGFYQELKFVKHHT